MKHIEKKKLKKKQKLALIFSGVFVVLLAAAITVTAVLNKGEDEPAASEPPVIFDGEAILYNYAIAYPEVKESSIQVISVRNKNGSFDLARPSEGYEFILQYFDSNGEAHIYYPNITEEDSSFTYSDLLALDSDGYAKITKLSYLTIALSAPAFEERIILSEIEGTEEEKLKAYGLDEESVNTLYFSYTVEEEVDGEKVKVQKSHTLKIGAQTVFGNGFYFMVDDRPYVYSSKNNSFAYALAGFASFIKPTLVAAGLDTDNGFGPYLTSAYYQWSNIKHDEPTDKIEEGSKVIAYVDTVKPVLYTDTETKTEDGYKGTGYDLIEIDLSTLDKNSANHKRVINSLVGRLIGTYYDPKDPLSNPNNKVVFTTTTFSDPLDFSEKEKLVYEYTITAIESIITESNDIFEKGVAVGDNKLVKVAYRLSIDGKSVGTRDLHAVIDLDSKIPDSAKEAVSKASVGTLDEPITFSVEYTKANANIRTGKKVITEIISIFDDDEEAEKISDKSVVLYRYSYEVDGVLSDPMPAKIDMTKAQTSEEGKKVQEALMGKSAGSNLKIEIAETTVYYEYLLNFVTYDIARVDYYITGDLISAFKFVNPSDRDPYYGESLYENLMTDGHKLYGLNSTACEEVVRMLGGIDPDGESGKANGLYGAEAIEIGITPEVMDKYGLWANTIYFELPRGLISYSTGEATSSSTMLEELDDYTYLDKIGFTLYISDPDPIDGSRYAACDLYDLVTKVPENTFLFLEYDFETFWARRSIVLMDIAYVTSMSVEFNMQEIKGEYDMELIHKTAYVFNNKKQYTVPTVSGYSVLDEITVKVTPNFEKEYTETKLTAYIKEKGYNFLSLTEFYDSLYGEDIDELKSAFPDSIGTDYFKEAIQVLYLTRLLDTLSEEEQQQALESAPVFRITLGTSTTSYKYVYEFYRFDDRRVMVRICQITPSGIELTPTSDFYISTFALKKLVSNFYGLMNGEKIDALIAYPDGYKSEK